MNFLFSSPKPWAWEAEKAFMLRREENPEIVRRSSVVSTIDRRGSTASAGEKGYAHVDNVNGAKV